MKKENKRRDLSSQVSYLKEVLNLAKKKLDRVKWELDGAESVREVKWIKREYQRTLNEVCKLKCKIDRLTRAKGRL